MEQEAAEESDGENRRKQKQHGLSKQAGAGDAFLRPFFWKRE